MSLSVRSQGLGLEFGSLLGVSGLPGVVRDSVSVVHRSCLQRRCFVHIIRCSFRAGL